MTERGKPAERGGGGLRVLHVVGGFDVGGIEVWLRGVCERAGGHGLRCDVVANRPEGPLRGAFEAAGTRVFHCGPLANVFGFARRFGRLLDREVPYDVVHSHVDPSGPPLAVAKRHGVPVRIAHSHTDRRELDRYPRLIAGPLAPLADLIRERSATGLVAVSRRAAAVQFGRGEGGEPPVRVIPNGIDLATFGPGDAAERVPSASKIRRGGGREIVHVGRLASPKNQAFLIDVFADLARRDRTARLTLIGDGPDRERLRARAAATGAADRITFAGSRDDLPERLRDFDLFVMPSEWEGFGIALVEAQAAGLPCLASDAIPREATFVEPLVTRLPLSAGVPAWAAAAERLLDRPPEVSAETIASAIAPADLSGNVAELAAFYRERLADAADAKRQ